MATTASNPHNATPHSDHKVNPNDNGPGADSFGDESEFSKSQPQHWTNGYSNSKGGGPNSEMSSGPPVSSEANGRSPISTSAAGSGAVPPDQNGGYYGNPSGGIVNNSAAGFYPPPPASAPYSYSSGSTGAPPYDGSTTTSPYYAKSGMGGGGPITTTNSGSPATPTLNSLLQERGGVGSAGGRHPYDMGPGGGGSYPWGGSAPGYGHSQPGYPPQGPPGGSRPPYPSSGSHYQYPGGGGGHHPHHTQLYPQHPGGHYPSDRSPYPHPQGSGGGPQPPPSSSPRSQPPNKAPGRGGEGDEPGGPPPPPGRHEGPPSGVWTPPVQALRTPPPVPVIKAPGGAMDMESGVRSPSDDGRPGSGEGVRGTPPSPRPRPTPSPRARHSPSPTGSNSSRCMSPAVGQPPIKEGQVSMPPRPASGPNSNLNSEPPSANSNNRATPPQGHNNGPMSSTMASPAPGAPHHHPAPPHHQVYPGSGGGPPGGPHHGGSVPGGPPGGAGMGPPIYKGPPGSGGPLGPPGSGASGPPMMSPYAYGAGGYPSPHGPPRGSYGGAGGPPTGPYSGPPVSAGGYGPPPPRNSSPGPPAPTGYPGYPPGYPPPQGWNGTGAGGPPVVGGKGGPPTAPGIPGQQPPPPGQQRPHPGMPPSSTVAGGGPPMRMVGPPGMPGSPYGQKLPPGTYPPPSSYNGPPQFSNGPSMMPTTVGGGLPLPNSNNNGAMGPPAVSSPNSIGAGGYPPHNSSGYPPAHLHHNMTNNSMGAPPSHHGPPGANNSTGPPTVTSLAASNSTTPHVSTPTSTVNSNSSHPGLTNSVHPAGGPPAGANSLNDNSGGDSNSVTNSSASQSPLVVSTGPDGQPIHDETSQQSTLSQSSDNSGGRATPKGGYQQSYGGPPGTPHSAPSPGSLASQDDIYMRDEGSPSHPGWGGRVPPSPVGTPGPQAKVENLQRLYEIDDHPERRAWLDKLLSFMEERGTPITQCPTISKNPLDLYKLFIFTKDRGGFLECTNKKAWKDVAAQLGIGPSSSGAYTLKKHYGKNLLPFECHFERGGIDPAPILAQVEAQSKKKSKASTTARPPSPGSQDSHDSYTGSSQDGYPPVAGYPGGYGNNSNAYPSPDNRPPQMHPGGYPPGYPRPDGYLGGPSPGYGGPGGYGPPPPPRWGAPPSGYPDPSSGPPSTTGAPTAGSVTAPNSVGRVGPAGYPVNSSTTSLTNSTATNSSSGGGGPTPPPTSTYDYQKAVGGAPNGLPPPAGAGPPPPGYPPGPYSMGGPRMLIRPHPPPQGGPGPSHPVILRANSPATPGTIQDTLPPALPVQRIPNPHGYAPTSQSGGMPPPSSVGGPPFMGPKGASGPPSGPPSSTASNSSPGGPRLPYGGPGAPYGPAQRPIYPGGPAPPGGWQARFQPPYPPGGAPPPPGSTGPRSGAPPSWATSGGPPNSSSGPSSSPSPSGDHRSGSPYHGPPGSQPSTGGPWVPPPPPGMRTGGPPRPQGPPGGPQYRPPGPPQSMPRPMLGPARREVYNFPPDSLEATQPLLMKRKKLNKVDVQPVEGWRLVMSLRSGLLCESTWALDTLNILLFDDNSIAYFGLGNMPGLLEALLEHWRASLIAMFDLTTDLEISNHKMEASRKRKREKAEKIQEGSKWYEMPQILNDEDYCLGGVETEVVRKGDKIRVLHHQAKDYTREVRFSNEKEFQLEDVEDPLFVTDEQRDWDLVAAGAYATNPDLWEAGGGDATNHIVANNAMYPAVRLPFVRILRDGKDYEDEDFDEDDDQEEEEVDQEEEDSVRGRGRKTRRKSRCNGPITNGNSRSSSKSNRNKSSNNSNSLKTGNGKLKSRAKNNQDGGSASASKRHSSSSSSATTNGGSTSLSPNGSGKRGGVREVWAVNSKTSSSQQNDDDPKSDNASNNAVKSEGCGKLNGDSNNSDENTEDRRGEEKVKSEQEHNNTDDHHQLSAVKLEAEEADAESSSAGEDVLSRIHKTGIILCNEAEARKRWTRPILEEENYQPDQPSLNLVTDSEDALGRRAIAVSNIFRNLSFVPGNETILGSSAGFLAVCGRLLLHGHWHPVRSSKQRNYERGEEEDTADSCTSLLPQKEWWWEHIQIIRENVMVALSNISGHMELSQTPESIALPLLSGLLEWSVSPSAAAQDPFYTVGPNSNISPQRLAIETLCKLCVQEVNVDLLVSTPPYSRLEQLCSFLSKKLYRSEDQIMREFAINLLYYFSAADTGLARTICLQDGNTVSLLVSFIEQAESNAMMVAQQHGVNALRDNPDSMGTSLDMLRRAANTLNNLSRHPDNRQLFLRQEQRLLNLVMSQILDQGVAGILSQVIYQISYEPPPKAEQRVYSKFRTGNAGSIVASDVAKTKEDSGETVASTTEAAASEHKQKSTESTS